MDIVLDANVYRQDLRMGGTQFQELFTYLRRTNCSLVLPGVVLLEAKSNYREFLSSTLRQLTREWDSLRKFAVTEIDELEAPIDIEHEVYLYEKDLMQPAPNVRVRLYNDYSGVDLAEVVRRGVERVKPANQNGEELRDVILWLMVVKYASGARCPVALISDDRDFQGPGGSLHETLASDLARAEAQVVLYKDIADFIAGNALGTEVMTEESFSRLVDSGLLRAEIQKRIRQSYQLGGEVLESEIDAVHFLSGNKYTVGDGSFYLECRLTGEASVRVREYQYSIQVGGYSPASNLATVIQGRDYSTPSSQVVVGRTATVINPLVFTSLNTASSSVAYPGRETFTQTGRIYDRLWSSGFTQPDSSENSYKCGFECEISARIDAGQLKALQTDRLAFTERGLVSDSGSSQ